MNMQMYEYILLNYEQSKQKIYLFPLIYLLIHHVLPPPELTFVKKGLSHDVVLFTSVIFFSFKLCT